MQSELNGLALCGVTGAGKTTLFKRLTETMATRHSATCLVASNRVIHAPALRRYASTRDVRSIEPFFREKLALFASFLSCDRSSSPDDRRLLILESLVINLLAELEIRDAQLFSRLDQLRSRLGVLLVRIDLEESELLERSVRSTKRHRGPKWAEYLSSLAPTEGEQLEIFRRRKAIIDSCYETAFEPKITLMTTQMSWDSYTEQIIALLRQEPV